MSRIELLGQVNDPAVMLFLSYCVEVFALPCDQSMVSRYNHNLVSRDLSSCHAFLHNVLPALFHHRVLRCTALPYTCTPCGAHSISLLYIFVYKRLATCDAVLLLNPDSRVDVTYVHMMLICCYHAFVLACAVCATVYSVFVRHVAMYCNAFGFAMRAIQCHCAVHIVTHLQHTVVAIGMSHDI